MLSSAPKVEDVQVDIRYGKGDQACPVHHSHILSYRLEISKATQCSAFLRNKNVKLKAKSSFMKF